MSEIIVLIFLKKARNVHGLQRFVRKIVANVRQKRIIDIVYLVDAGKKRYNM